MPHSLHTIRQDFPIFSTHPDLIYLDSAASAQKPKVVIEAMKEFQETSYGNVHRGMHGVTEKATASYEEARTGVQKFIGAQSPTEIIFTKSCTESLNLIARSFGQALNSGDCIVLSILEHHSNIIPWLQLKEERGIEIIWIDIDDEGQIKLEDLQAAFETKPVKLVSITGQSNVLGTRPPLEEIIQMAHKHNAKVCIDAAQLIGHHPINVQELDCDFLAFSGHKLYGPTGIGVLYGKEELLKDFPPFLGGGMMIDSVTKDGFTPADLPAKFEAGTPPITEAIGLHAAINWLSKHSWEDIEAHEQELLSYTYESLTRIPNLQILGTKNQKPKTKNHSGCISFTLDHIHPHDLTDALSQKSICLRAGHHCTQPLHNRLGIKASTRVSVGLYNTEDEIDRLVQAITEIQTRLA